MNRDIYSMYLHEVMEVKIYDADGEEDTIGVLRVPGGWVYGFDMSEPFFVPLSDEFKTLHITEVERKDNDLLDGMEDI